MRHIDKEAFTETVAALCIKACTCLPEDVYDALLAAREREAEGSLARCVLEELAENARIAAEEGVPVCQDTGLAIVFLEIGREAVLDFDIRDAVCEGVRRGYGDGYLRKSVAKHPLCRENTGDNTPPVVHMSLTEGEHIKITVAPKGGGSENMSSVKVFPPAAGRQGVIDHVKECVRSAGANPCPPIILGIGLGGTIEAAALCSKKALLRRLGSENPVPEDAALEQDILREVNSLNIGPAGYGGRTTCLGVFVKSIPCHIASLPVAVTFQCHAARHAEAVL
ncbi:MAG: fumarate hydratase [Abditibacteriota bacterium]|nr:fumarate hydratase [Abditibacteriota bacterium]